MKTRQPAMVITMALRMHKSW